LKPTKVPAPPVPPIPHFEPLVFSSEENESCIPSTVDSSDPVALFSVFFEESTIQMLINAANKNAEIKRLKYSVE
jgi:hypothetical protein